MMKMLLIICLMFLFLTGVGIAQTYYVKNGGNDNLDGLSDATAWANTPEMNGWYGSATLLPGDIVLLARGDSWRKTIILNYSGSSHLSDVDTNHYWPNAITYSSYDNGGGNSKPVINGDSSYALNDNEKGVSYRVFSGIDFESSSTYPIYIRALTPLVDNNRIWINDFNVISRGNDSAHGIYFRNSETPSTNKFQYIWITNGTIVGIDVLNRSSGLDGLQFRGNSRYIYINRIKIKDYGHTAIYIDKQGNSDIYIWENEVDGSNSGFLHPFGILADRVVISRNYFHDYAARGQIQSSAENIALINNVFFHGRNCCDGGIPRDCTGDGDTNDWNDCRYDSVTEWCEGSEQQRGGGFSIDTSYAPYQINNFWVVGNTVAYLAEYFTIGRTASVVNGFYFKNNILYDISMASSSLDDPLGSDYTSIDYPLVISHYHDSLFFSGVEIENNLFYNPTKGNTQVSLSNNLGVEYFPKIPNLKNNDSFNTLNDCESGTRFPHLNPGGDGSNFNCDDNWIDDPGFVDSLNGDLRLSTQSLAKNNAKILDDSELSWMVNAPEEISLKFSDVINPLTNFDDFINTISSVNQNDYGNWDLGAIAYVEEVSQTCAHFSDEEINGGNCNWKLDKFELDNYVNLWKSNSGVTLVQVIEAIGIWKAGS